MFEEVSCHLKHRNAVANVSSRVRHFYDSKTSFRVYHGSTNSTRQAELQKDTVVDVSGMKDVLFIDSHAMTAFVEPNVPMDRLVDETLKYGLVPPVVMEFPGITVGGGFSGTSGESSSFRHGLFDRTVKAIQIVLGNGEVATASADTNPDLFYGAAASFGTLGVITLLALDLAAAKPYVELTYLTVGGIKQAVEVLRQPSTHHDYMDGMLFSQDRGVVCLGRLVDSIPDCKIKRFSRPWDDWFYINAEKQSAKHRTWTEHVPLQDYLFRYERGAFWISKYTYRYFAIPCNRFTRWALDTYTHTRIMYSALHHSGLATQYIIQDVMIPFDHCSEFVSYLDENFGHYPLWLCPISMRGESAFAAYGPLAERHDETGISDTRPDAMLNFGVWGPAKCIDATAWHRDFEAFIQKLGGHKWLYAHTYFTKRQFWDIYDEKLYRSVREKYHALHLPTIWDKVSKVPRTVASQDLSSRIWAVIWAIWPLAGLYGWLMCAVHADYLLHRKKK